MAYPMGCFMAAIMASQNASRQIREEEEKKLKRNDLYKSSNRKELLAKLGEPKVCGEHKEDGMGHLYKASRDSYGWYWKKIW